MRFTRCLLWIVVVLPLFAVACQNGPETQDYDFLAEQIPMSSDLKGTVAEVCSLQSAGEEAIRGYGLVVGLGKNGSSEVPPRLRTKLIKYLKTRIRLGDPNFNLESVSPQDFLADRDTAVVVVDSIIPPGAPVGTRFDIGIVAMPRTQTTSLEGGLLLPTNLSVNRGGMESASRNLKTLAVAEGPIFVNPFLDPKKREDTVKYRQGQVLNGAVLKESMPIRLHLRKPDYHTASIVQRRINERFASEGPKIASAKNRYFITLTIPPKWRHDYEYFLQLVMRLPLQGGSAAFEAHAKRIAYAMTKPAVNYDGLALVWEAMGRQVLPAVRKMYSSNIPAASYYSARAGLRMGDDRLTGPIVMCFARTPGSPLQLEAIRELGRHPEILEAGDLLRNLLNEKNELIRIAAYESLVKRNDGQVITRHNMDGDFIVDQVCSGGPYVIYASRTGQPKIVMFGKDMPISKPFFYKSHDVVTIYSKKGDPDATEQDLQKDHVVAYRSLPGTAQISQIFRLPYEVWPLIETMSAPPKPDPDTGEIRGLGLNYGQVVGVLCRMCKQKNVPAKFVLQQLPQLRRIYQTTPSMGRPDEPTP